MNKLVFLSVFVFACDQLLKSAMLGWLPADAGVPVVDGFFSLTLAFNRGAAFGIFGGRYYFLVGFAAAACAAVFLMMRSALRDGQRLRAASLACLLGAVCGNVADRLRIGAVVDFLDFSFGSYHWPTFNLADTVICLSVAALCLDVLLSSDDGKKS